MTSIDWPVHLAAEFRKVVSAVVLRDVEESGGTVYLVGGSVRDVAMGLDVSKDWDIVIRGVPAAGMEAILHRHGSMQAVGASFGVYKFTPPGGKTIDVALPRTERSFGSGHKDFEVTSDPFLPIEKDLARRDFSINAMAVDAMSGALVDPFGGLQDVRSGTLRTLYPDSFLDDPLRILRGLGFVSRFMVIPDVKTFSMMEAHSHLLGTVSGERVSAELRKLLAGEKPALALEMMYQCGAMKVVLPEVHALHGLKQPGKWHDADVLAHTLRVVQAARRDRDIERCGDPDLMMAALLHDIGKISTFSKDPQTGEIHFYGHQDVGAKQTAAILRRLQASSAGFNLERIVRLVEFHMEAIDDKITDRSLRRLVHRIGDPQDALLLADLKVADKRGGARPDRISFIIDFRRRLLTEIDRKTPFNVQSMEINGRDIMGLGLQEGPEVGRVLQALFARVQEDVSLNRRDVLLRMAEEMLQTDQQRTAPEDLHSR